MTSRRGFAPACARLSRFAAVGLVNTAIAYIVFVLLLRHHVGYVASSCASWGSSLCCSYAFNRRYTFRLRSAMTPSEVTSFCAGYLLQLLLITSMYALLIGRLHMAASAAFGLNLCVASVFSFVFMERLVFRQRSQASVVAMQ